MCLYTTAKEVDRLLAGVRACNQPLTTRGLPAQLSPIISQAFTQGGFMLLFFAQFLESRIGAQKVPNRITLKFR